MKTIQNKIWMRFLIIGLLFSSLTISNTSCNKIGDSAMEGEFYFINKTNYSITFSAGFEKYNLLPQTTIGAFVTTDISDKQINANNYYSPLIKERAYKVPIEPIIIKFNNQKCMIIANEKGENNPLIINNYISEKLGERKYKFTYTFTEADYNRAVTCP